MSLFLKQKAAMINQTMLSLPPISGFYFKIMTGKKPTQSKYCNSYHPIENEYDFAKRYILLVTIGFENV